MSSKVNHDCLLFATHCFESPRSAQGMGTGKGAQRSRTPCCSWEIALPPTHINLKLLSVILSSDFHATHHSSHVKERWTILSFSLQDFPLVFKSFFFFFLIPILLTSITQFSPSQLLIRTLTVLP